MPRAAIANTEAKPAGKPATTRVEAGTEVDEGFVALGDAESPNSVNTARYLVCGLPQGCREWCMKRFGVAQPANVDFAHRTEHVMQATGRERRREPDRNDPGLTVVFVPGCSRAEALMNEMLGFTLIELDRAGRRSG